MQGRTRGLLRLSQTLFLISMINRLENEQRDIQSSMAIFRKVRILLYKRMLKKNISSTIVVTTTPVAAAAADGGSVKFDVTPGGGGPLGVLVRSTPGGSVVILTIGFKMKARCRGSSKMKMRHKLE